jgi:hypothetical protein
VNCPLQFAGAPPGGGLPPGADGDGVLGSLGRGSRDPGLRDGAAGRVAAAPGAGDPDPAGNGAPGDGNRPAGDWAAVRGPPPAPEHAATSTTDPQASRSITRFKAVDRPNL